MKIYIPSSGRPRKQTTVNSLPKELLKCVRVVVPKHELSDYLRTVGSKVQVLAPNIPKGIGPARQWCCDQEIEKVLMMDDDLVFATRRQDEPTKFRDSTEDEVEGAVRSLYSMLDPYSHVGMATREGGNRFTETLDYNTRLLRILGYNTRTLRKFNIRFDAIPVMEDFYVSLSLLTNGQENVKLNWMVQNQHGSGTEGGCSQYRDMDLQAQAAHTLQSKFPDFVTVVEKETKTAWGGGVRTDVRIQWKKALEYGRRNG